MSNTAGKEVQAFVLLEAKAGMALEASRQVAKVQGVVSSYAVTGPFDVIAQAQAADIKALAQIVVAEIQALSSVTRTVTCIVLEGGTT